MKIVKRFILPSALFLALALFWDWAPFVPPIPIKVAGAQPGITPNQAVVLGSALGADPSVTVQGLDANISLNLVTKGTGVAKVNGTAIPGLTGGAGIFTTITASGLVTNTGGEVSTLGVSPGITATLKAAPLRAFHTFTDVPTPGTVLATLYTYTLPANGLATVGQSLHIKGSATVAANANNKTWLVTFGATTLWTSTAAAFNNVLITIDCDLFMTGAATQKSICNGQANTLTGVSLTINAGSTVSTPAETLSAPVVINFQATTPTSAGDLTARHAFVDWYPNGQ